MYTTVSMFVYFLDIFNRSYYRHESDVQGTYNKNFNSKVFVKNIEIKFSLNQWQEKKLLYIPTKDTPLGKNIIQLFVHFFTGPAGEIWLNKYSHDFISAEQKHECISLWFGLLNYSVQIYVGTASHLMWLISKGLEFCIKNAKFVG